MPCNQSSSLTDCRWWDRSGLTGDGISLHRLDNPPFETRHLDKKDKPLFLPPPVPPTGYCSDGFHDCLTAYENISHVREIIDNMVCPLIDKHGSPLVNFSEYDTLFFIILDQSIDLNRLYFWYRLVGGDLCSTKLQNNSIFIRLETKTRVIFGPYIVNNTMYSAAIQLEIVAHELCHMLISKIPSANVFSDEGESGALIETGALEESVCDIFAVLINKRIRNTWNWEIGQNMGTESGKACRNFCDPESSSPPQPSHYTDCIIGGDAHINCGIHNKAFCNIIDSGYFEVNFLIELLIRTILNITIADFSHSRKAMQECAENMLQRTGLEDADVKTQVDAISQAFIDVGIELPEQI